jgi:hypothetical protein
LVKPVFYNHIVAASYNRKPSSLKFITILAEVDGHLYRFTLKEFKLFRVIP